MDSSDYETIKRFAKYTHKVAIEKGWWGKNGKEKRNFGEMIALMHSELSEALEAARCNFPKVSDHIPEYLMIEEEFADVIIRILDVAEGFGYKVVEALEAKMKFNETRPFRHGGKKF